MTAWWEAMTAAQQVFAVIAMPATVILILQVVLQLFGMGHQDGLDAPGDGLDSSGQAMDLSDHGAEGDIQGSDGSFNLDYQNEFSVFSLAELKLLTVRGVIAFLAIGGWTGVVLGQTSLHIALVVLLAAAAGLCAAYLIAVALRAAMRLQSSGNLELRNAIGKTGTVYIPIPAQRGGFGKVTLLVQGQSIEADAVSDSGEPLQTGSMVEVKALDDRLLVVAPLVKAVSEKTETV